MSRRRFEFTSRIAGGLVAVMLLIPATAAEAQTTTNPRYVVFAPSPDHSSVTSSGAPVVRSYQLEIYPYAGSQPLAVLDLGKPDPEPDGYIRVNFANLLAAPPSTGTVLQGVVAAVGPGGTSRSGPSAAFMFNGCGYYVSPVSVAITGAGGSAPSTLSTGAGCQWIATTGDSWIAVASASTGSGSAGITVSAAPNPDAYPRNGTLAVGSAVIVVKQSAATTSSPPSPPIDGTSPDGTTVPTAPRIVDASGAIWTIGSDTAILRNGVQMGGAWGSKIYWKNSTIYAYGLDLNWWQWSGSSWSNLGPTMPGSTGGGTTSGSTSPDGAIVPTTATQIVDNSGAVWTIGSNTAILRNGAQVGTAWGSKIYWKSSTIYVYGLDLNWWQWSGSSWSNLGPTMPGATGGGTGSSTTSPDATRVPTNASQIVDSSGAVWTIGTDTAILRNGVQVGGAWGSQIYWKDNTIYVYGLDLNWWQWSGSAWLRL
jgi:hypothetical protein